MNIIEFCRARIAEDKRAAEAQRELPRRVQDKQRSPYQFYSRHTPKRAICEADFLLSVVMGVEETVEGTIHSDDDLVDNPMIVQLAVMSVIWQNHRDFDMKAWFPSMYKPQGESDPT